MSNFLNHKKPRPAQVRPRRLGLSRIVDVQWTSALLLNRNC